MIFLKIDFELESRDFARDLTIESKIKILKT